MTVGQRIAQKRKELGLSQEALGEQLGVSRQAIYKWESDTTLPEIEKLVAMSRIFSVSVGWLLGVEDDAPADPEEKTSGELTEEQLRMVEEIVDRYLQAQPAPASPKRRRWVMLAGAAAAAALAVGLIKVSSRLGQVTSDYNSLQNSIQQINISVNNQISSIADQVESILKSQNDLTADYGTELSSCDLRAGTVTFRVWALPKTYTDGMTADFVAQSGTNAVTQPGTEDGGHRFEAAVTCPLSDDIILSVVFSDGGRQNTQLLQSYDCLLSGSYPEVMVMGNLWGSKNGGKVDAGEVVWVDFPSGVQTMSSFGDEYLTAEITELRLGLFADRELVMWYDELDEKPDFFRGDWPENARYFIRPAAVKLDPEKIYCEAALVTDEYGRRWMVWDSPVRYDEGEKFCDSVDADTAGLTTDPADWKLDRGTE